MLLIKQLKISENFRNTLSLKDKLNSNDSVCIMRSAFLGDWLTIIPFVTYLLYECGIKKENIHFLIMNNQGVDPVSLIIGKDSVLSKNTSVIDNSSLKTLYKSARQVRQSNRNKINTLILLPFTHDDRKSILKKKLLARFIYRNTRFIGFQNSDSGFLVESQYTSYFDKLGIEYSIDQSQIRQLLLSEGFSLSNKTGGRKLIAIYPNSKLEMKIWPVEKYRALIEILHQKIDAHFVLLGGKEDFLYNQNLLSLLSSGIEITNIAGELSIKKTIEFFSSVDLLVANDGAPVHFAALVNTPMVALYTYKEPIGSWDPLPAENFVTYRTDVSCKHCFRMHCPNPVCLTTIPVDLIAEVSLEMLENKFNRKESRLFFSKNPLSYLDKYVSA